MYNTITTSFNYKMINNLIPVTKHTINNENVNSVSARKLHNFLENTDNVNTWFKRQSERAMLVEGIDFIAILQQSNGGRPSLDYAITLSGAKEIAMLNGGDKGKQARTYFINCEKQLKEQSIFKVPQTFKEALLLAVEQQETIEKQEILLLEQQPKVDFANQVQESTNAIDFASASQVMKLGYGRNTLFQKCRELEILKDSNLPYQQYVDKGYFIVLETTFTCPKSGDRKINLKTMITGKGQIWLLKKINV